MNDLKSKLGVPEASEKSKHPAQWLRDLVILASSEDVGGSEPYPCGVNGYVIQIPRDLEVPLPRRHVEVMQNAQKVIMERTVNMRGEVEERSRVVPRFAFRVVKTDLTPEEVEEYTEKANSILRERAGR
jgi:hypothetical protein